MFYPLSRLDLCFFASIAGTVAALPVIGEGSKALHAMDTFQCCFRADPSEFYVHWTENLMVHARKESEAGFVAICPLAVPSDPFEPEPHHWHIKEIVQRCQCPPDFTAVEYTLPGNRRSELRDAGGHPIYEVLPDYRRTLVTCTVSLQHKILVNKRKKQRAVEMQLLALQNQLRKSEKGKTGSETKPPAGQPGGQLGISCQFTNKFNKYFTAAEWARDKARVSLFVDRPEHQFSQLVATSRNPHELYAVTSYPKHDMTFYCVLSGVGLLSGLFEGAIFTWPKLPRRAWPKYPHQHFLSDISSEASPTKTYRLSDLSNNPLNLGQWYDLSQDP